MRLGVVVKPLVARWRHLVVSLPFISQVKELDRLGLGTAACYF